MTKMPLLATDKKVYALRLTLSVVRDTDKNVYTLRSTISVLTLKSKWNEIAFQKEMY